MVIFISRRVKFAKQLNKMNGVFEETKTDYWSGKANISDVLEDNIAKTCLHIIVSLVNQNMRVTSSKKKAEKVFKQFNKDVKIKRKMDSLVFNQLAWGNSVFYFDVTDNPKPKLMVYDTSTYELVIDPTKDEFQGIYQKTSYRDPEALKEGRSGMKQIDKFIPSENLIIVPGIGKGYGESVVTPAYPFVKAKKELVNSLYDLVKRLGLLTVVGVDLPGDVSTDDLEDYLDDISDLVETASANSIWILPKETTVEGVRSSGEARIIESVKSLIDLLDEEIRKCLFIPDTFLSSLSANRATAKEQRYLIASMVSHIRDLVEESLTEMYDALLKHHGIKAEYKFTWGNINLPEPEKLFDFILQLLLSDVMTEDEIRSYINLGSMPKELVKKRLERAEQAKQGIGEGKNIYEMMNNPGGVKKDGKDDKGQVQPKQNIN